MYREVAIELCIPAEEALQRLRDAAKLSFWTERQRRDLNIAGALTWVVYGNKITLVNAATDPPELGRYNWAFSASIEGAGRWCRMDGRLQLRQPAPPAGPFAGLILFVGASWLAGGIAGGLLGFLLAVYVGAVLAGTPSYDRFISGRRADFEAFLSVVFEGVIVNLRVSQHERS